MGEKVKMRYPKNYLVRTISISGFFSFEGNNYHVGEHFAGCRMGLYESDDGTIQLHYANLHLGNLAYDSEGRFRPTSPLTIQNPSTHRTLNESNKV